MMVFALMNGARDVRLVYRGVSLRICVLNAICFVVNSFSPKPLST
jgi:hypothetical protein